MKKNKAVSEIAYERAKRVRYLRGNLRYSRRKFCEKYEKFGVSSSALQTWEDVRWNGLTENGARKLVESFKEEGLNISVEWLMYGIGEDPFKNMNPLGNLQKENHLSEEEKIARELKLYHELNPGMIDVLVADDGLAPFLLPGDRVAGMRYFDKDIPKAIGQICIVQTLYGHVLVRQLDKGHDSENYLLKCTNKNAHVEHIASQAKLFSAAPIIWVRKPG